MDIKKELGEKIKRLRKQNALTQEQLAEMIDISSRNLSNIEQGISFPKPETLEHILISLNTTTQELFANEHIKTKKDWAYRDTGSNGRRCPVGLSGESNEAGRSSDRRR